jgi:hypothetical protein
MKIIDHGFSPAGSGMAPQRRQWRRGRGRGCWLTGATPREGGAERICGSETKEEGDGEEGVILA